MKTNFLWIPLLFITISTCGLARAQDTILDDIDTSTDSGWIQLRIRFTLPVNYVRHFPQERGQLLQIFFTVGGMDTEQLSLGEVTRKVSPTPVIPGTEITYKPPLSLNLLRDPSSLDVRFDRTVNYDVRPGDDHRSIVIYIPIAPTETKPADTAKVKSGKKHDSAE